MTAALPSHGAMLRGTRIDLVEVGDNWPQVFAELAPVLRRPEVFAGGYGGGPTGLPADDAAFVEFLHGYAAMFHGGYTFVVRDSGGTAAGGTAAGCALGTTSLGRIDLRYETAEIGWTAYAPEAWGTGVNAEAKLLIGDFAFGAGFSRIEIRVDARNTRSLAAVARLGAVREGVLRRNKPRADGSWRDTVVHSILADEWPGVRSGLRRRIDTAEREHDIAREDIARENKETES